MRVGIIGCGNIVKCCLDAMDQLPEISCEAIFVQERSRSKAETLMGKHPINKLYTNYKSFLADPEIDIVYVGIRITSYNVCYTKLLRAHII